MKHSVRVGSAIGANCIDHAKRRARVSVFLAASVVVPETLPRRIWQFSPSRHFSSQTPTSSATASSSRSRSTAISSAAPDHELAPSAANPPPTTRPPPLILPAQPPDGTAFLSKSNFSYLFAQGMAYLKFYKTGMRHIYINTRLLYFPSSSTTAAAADAASSHNNRSNASNDNNNNNKNNPDPHPPPPLPSTRAHLHLRLRWWHDVRRLPLFALILLVCGELTPLVVLALPRAVPLPCRVPAQADKILRADEARRRAGRAEARARARMGMAGIAGSDMDGSDAAGAAGAQIAADAAGAAGAAGPGEDRSGVYKGGWAGGIPAALVPALAEILGLPSRAWTPRFVLAPRVRARLALLAVDDALLIQSGGAGALVPEEVRLACADRGIDVLGRSGEELRAALGRWLRLTDARRLGLDGRERAVVRLLVTEESGWGALEG